MADLLAAVPWWIWAIGLNIAGSVGVYRDLCAQTQGKTPARQAVDVPSPAMRTGGVRA